MSIEEVDLDFLRTVSYTEDVPSRHIRIVASEVLSQREEIARLRAELHLANEELEIMQGELSSFIPVCGSKSFYVKVSQ